MLADELDYVVGVDTHRDQRAFAALALRWGDVEPVITDLVSWRPASGRPDASELVFPGHDGMPWTEGDYKHWRKREFRRAVLAAGLPTAVRPYELRHAFCSLLIANGGRSWRSPLRRVTHR